LLTHPLSSTLLPADCGGFAERYKSLLRIPEEGESDSGVNVKAFRGEGEQDSGLKVNGDSSGKANVFSFFPESFSR
jgi:hypothetical protein